MELVTNTGSSGWSYNMDHTSSLCWDLQKAWKPTLNSPYVESDVQVQWSLLDPNVTDGIPPRTTTFHPNSTYHVVAAVSTRQPCFPALNCCMDQPVVNTAPYFLMTRTQQDPTYWICGLLSLAASCASTHCLDACNKQQLSWHNNWQWTLKQQLSRHNNWQWTLKQQLSWHNNWQWTLKQQLSWHNNLQW